MQVLEWAYLQGIILLRFGLFLIFKLGADEVTAIKDSRNQYRGGTPKALSHARRKLIKVLRLKPFRKKQRSY